MTTDEAEHYMTIDRARVGQLDAPRSGWRCSVVGYVYAGGGRERAAIELDDGAAYVLQRRAVETEPDCNAVALYRHWAGSDWWYSPKQADGGLAGYMCR